MVGWNSVKLVKNLNLFNILAFLFSPVDIIRIISSEKYIKRCSTYIFAQQRTIRQQLSVRVFVFPGPQPFAWPSTLALAPNLYLPALVPTPDLYLPVQVKILLLPQLLLIQFTTSNINITATSTTTTTATTTASTTNYNNNGKKCICGSKVSIKWPLNGIWSKSQVLF